jgi:hypothetical protein
MIGHDSTFFSFVVNLIFFFSRLFFLMGYIIAGFVAYYVYDSQAIGFVFWWAAFMALGNLFTKVD